MPTFDEAAPICRGKNLSWETIMLFFNHMPKEPMAKKLFHEYVEKNINGWTQTHSQIARQLALYYEKDGVCYPRFSKSTTLVELYNYIQSWAHNYFIPNPYTPSLMGNTPTNIYAFLKTKIFNGETDFKDAINKIFGINLSSQDKVKVYLANYTDIIFGSNNSMSLNDKINNTTPILTPDIKAATDPEIFFHYFDAEKNRSNKSIKIINDFPLQQIFYGAPGTGKSNTVKQVTDGHPKENVFRTTFHPDSDYSTFVGCYKPSMGKAKVYGPQGVVQVGGTDVEKDEITYKFVPQAFVNAYVRAYHTEDPVFLVIEEINRGNCAQIFGDMFQLLDRNAETGESDYAIKPDTDLQHYLCSVMGDALTDCDEIQSGEEMRLPSNLYIWATMNTSDQSLFPIDSAFKRRWDWKYIPIADAGKGYQIEVGCRAYDWWDFLEKINAEIGEVTSSEDKMLGYFFAKAKDGKVTADMFVSKVLFYLWNDVFKDFGTDRPLFEKGKNDKDNTVYLSFKDFFKPNGDVNEENVIRLLDNLKVKASQEAEEDDDGNTPSTDASKRNYDKFSVNGEGAYGKNRLAEACVKKYIELHSEKSADEVVTDWKTLGVNVSHFIETEEEFDARTDNSKDRSTRVECNGSALYVVHSGYGADNGKADVLMNAVNSKDWGITIEKL